MKGKKIFLSTAIASLFIATTVVIIHSCKKDPFEDVDLITNTDFTSATIGVQFVNSKTGENIGLGTSDDVTVVIGGTDAAQVIDVAIGTNFKPARGFLSLAIKEGVIPQASDPVDFTITASCPGYLSTSQSVSIDAAGGTGVIIRMVEIADAPSGVAFLETTSAFSAADMSSATGTFNLVTISTPVPSVSGPDPTIASLSIPAGEKFYYKDANGNQLRISDPLGITFGHFSGVDNAALAPVLNELYTNIGGVPMHLDLTSMITVQMTGTVTGKTVTDLESPITVTQGVSTVALNASNVPIHLGDTISSWSMDDATGVWSYEGYATVVAGTGANAGNFEVQYPVTHFSKYALGFMSITCASSVINWTTKTTETVALNIFCDGLLHLSTIVPNDAVSTTIKWLKAAGVKTYTISHPFDNINSFQLALSFVACGTTTVTPPLVNPKVTVKLSVYCISKPGVIFLPTTPVYATEVGTNTWFLACNMKNGLFQSTSLKQNAIYKFGTYFDGKFYSSDPYIIDKTNYPDYSQEISPTSCSKLH